MWPVMVQVAWRAAHSTVQQQLLATGCNAWNRTCLISYMNASQGGATARDLQPLVMKLNERFIGSSPEDIVGM